MPPGDETYYNIERMHVAFAVAVFALLAATVWMWAADSRRAWKEYQREYRTADGAARPVAGHRADMAARVDDRLQLSRRCPLRPLHDLPSGDRPRRRRSRPCRQPYAAATRRLDLFVGAG